MTENYNVGLGWLDGFFANRLKRRGPVEFYWMKKGQSRLFRMVVEYKWNNSPDVKLARKLNRILRWVKFIDASQYKQIRKQVLYDIKQGAHGDMDAYNAYVKMIDNPKIGKNYDDFVCEILADSPKTDSVICKFVERDLELQKFNLDYRSDYIVNDSKKIDIWISKAIFLYTFLRCDANLMWKCIRIGMRLQGDIARLNVAKFLWGDFPHIINAYQARLDAQQELYNTATELYQKTVDDTRKAYKKAEKNIEKKYAGIAQYKELIRTGQLSKFVKR